MNAVSELISNRRKLVREVACLAAEGRLFQRVASLCRYHFGICDRPSNEICQSLETRSEHVENADYTREPHSRPQSLRFLWSRGRRNGGLW